MTNQTCTLCNEPSTQEIEGHALCENCAEKAKNYQDRLERRLERLHAAADKEKQAYQQDHDRAHTMAQAIPFGQPMMPDHYSYKRDRNYRDKIHKTFGRAFAHLERAKQLEQRAQAAEAHRAISSDDPMAIVKLQEKIDAAKAEQERMKTANAEARKAKKQRVYAPFELTNNNANIKRMEQRVQDLKAKQVLATLPGEALEETHGDIRLVRDPEGNRLRLHFPGKPASDVIKLLKSKGFIWSGKNGAWQRQLNSASEFAAEQVIRAIKTKE